MTGIWRFKVDPDNIGLQEQWQTLEYYAMNWNLCKEVGVPHNWNTMPGLDRYEGTAWYFKELRRSGLGDLNHKDCFLQFKAVNYHATVWWNGRKIGIHQGGYLPFEFRVQANWIQATNIIAVRVENFRQVDRIPALVYDWFNWSGIHRGVDLAIFHPQRIICAHIETTSLDNDFALLKITCFVSAAQAIRWQIFDGATQVMWGRETLRGVNDAFRIKLPSPRVWDIGKPHMYEFVANLSNSSEEYCTQFGIRTIAVKGTSVFLNGRPVKLRGINLCEEQMPYGRCYPAVMRMKELRDIRALGFNAIRTANFPHDEDLPQLCDKLGIILLEEIPVNGGCNFTNPKVFRLAARMLKDLIYRDFNHPSVIMWSCGNEVPVEKYACDRFMRQLLGWGRYLDQSRIIFYASSRLFSDRTRRSADVNGVNEGFGGNYLTTNVLNYLLDVIFRSNPTTPWIITGFGAEAKLGFQDNKKDFAQFTEDKQASVIAHSIRIFNDKPYVAGWFISVYRDFKSPLRGNEYQQGFNRKGIVSELNQRKHIARIMPAIIQQSGKDTKIHIGTAMMLQKWMKFGEKAIILVISKILARINLKKMTQYFNTSDNS